MKCIEISHLYENNIRFLIEMLMNSQSGCH